MDVGCLWICSFATKLVFLGGILPIFMELVVVFTYVFNDTAYRKNNRSKTR